MTSPHIGEGMSAGPASLPVSEKHGDEKALDRSDSSAKLTAVSEIYHFHAPAYSDYEHIATNGLAYTKESGGFDDWLKKGIPEPKDPYTVFAELRCPDVAPVLWATASWTSVAFLVTDETLRLFRRNHLTGFEVTPVQIVKVATKGKRKKVVETGEPEDQILARKNVIKEIDHLPVLWGIRVTALMEVTPDSGSWGSKSRLIQTYSFSRSPDCDLFYPSLDGQRYGGHLFCSAHLKDALTADQVRNVAFTPFQQWKEREFNSEGARWFRAVFEEEWRKLNTGEQ